MVRCHVVETPYIPKVIGTELKNNQTKRKHYNLSLVIGDWLTEMASANKQWLQWHLIKAALLGSLTL